MLQLLLFFFAQGLTEECPIEHQAAGAASIARKHVSREVHLDVDAAAANGQDEQDADYAQPGLSAAAFSQQSGADNDGAEEEDGARRVATREAPAPRGDEIVDVRILHEGARPQHDVLDDVIGEVDADHVGGDETDDSRLAAPSKQQREADAENRDDWRVADAGDTDHDGVEPG